MDVPGRRVRLWEPPPHLLARMGACIIRATGAEPPFSPRSCPPRPQVLEANLTGSLGSHTLTAHCTLVAGHRLGDMLGGEGGGAFL